VLIASAMGRVARTVIGNALIVATSVAASANCSAS
jgi:hypothetical protein